METRTLILLSTSHDKRTGRKLFNRSDRRVCSPDFLPHQHKQLLEQRNEVLWMLHGGPPKLYNEDQQSGFRNLRKCNRKLAKGSDFGGSEVGDYYPAYERYSGRFFMEMRPEFWKNKLGSNSSPW